MTAAVHRHWWRAGCAGTRTSGSEGGSRNRTGRAAGTAPRPDPYDFARLPRNRRLLVRYERDPELHDALLDRGCALLCWRFLDRDGLC
jgi:hypothetical protein